MRKRYKIRLTEVLREYRESYEEFECEEEELNGIVERIRDGNSPSRIKAAHPSYEYIDNRDWDTYDTESIESSWDIEDEEEIEELKKKNHLPVWF
jgi:hypothetical protein